MPVVQVKWVGMLSPCLQFPVTLNLISPNQELGPVPLHISDCTAQVSAPLLLMASLFITGFLSAATHLHIPCPHSLHLPVRGRYFFSGGWSQDGVAGGCPPA